ncbi:GNAT family N-acetyltransferase [Streptomyces litchfieldiae]|uniref:GNAT family N-acetyltransferase n=1 Tax=Streptomyces litchfieldiae TaxID=3075543 RepID=A0ABU2MV53_9ACTN|nr:GNAT family N-acetyltransferase [Streptomyces sp. DSM 44938]MDT0345450.1 GNAT family N-acetyltransferase [Streptomyces sp. DSM 44938]
MVSLRVVTAADWPLWREVRLAALADAPEAFRARLGDWHRGGEEQWRARLTMPGAHNVVALLDGRAAGSARGEPGEDGVSELRSVWVGPWARGRGIGERLVAAVENWARESGASALRLAVVPGNAPAIALYRRLGFVATEEPGEWLPDGVTRERVMVKALRPPSG